MTLIGQKLRRIEYLARKVFCATGPGGGVDPTCSSGEGSSGGGEAVSVSTFEDKLPLNQYGRRAGVVGVGPVHVKAYRVGILDGTRKGGVFFAGDKSSAQQYAALHEGYEVKEYSIKLKNALVAGHQGDLTQKFFGKPYGEMMDQFQRKYGKEGSGVATDKFDKKMLSEVKKRGYDGLILLAPAPPAKSEVAVIGGKKFEGVSEIGT